MREKKYCQYCGSELSLKFHERRERLYCENCNLYCWENPLPGIAAIVLNDNKTKILLIKRGVAPQKGKWALPGGFVDKDELPQSAAIRELREETGLIGKNPQLLDVTLQLSPTFGGVIAIGFVFEITNGDLKPGDDAIDTRYFDLSNLPEIAFECHNHFVEKLKKIVLGCKERNGKI